jgi:hypothetical protein
MTVTAYWEIRKCSMSSSPASTSGVRTTWRGICFCLPLSARRNSRNMGLAARGADLERHAVGGGNEPVKASINFQRAFRLRRLRQLLDLLDDRLHQGLHRRAALQGQTVFADQFNDLEVINNRFLTVSGGPRRDSIDWSCFPCLLPLINRQFSSDTHVCFASDFPFSAFHHRID